MASPLADDSESFLGYTNAREMRKKLDAKLAEMDGKAQKARRENGSHARGVRGVLRQAELILLVDEIRRRLMLERQRQKTAERVATHRARHGRRDRQRNG